MSKGTELNPPGVTKRISPRGEYRGKDAPSTRVRCCPDSRSSTATRAVSRVVDQIVKRTPRSPGRTCGHQWPISPELELQRRQLLDLTTVGRDDGETARVAAGENDRAVVGPGSTEGEGRPADRDHRAAVDRRLAKLAIGKEGDPGSIGREERRSGALGTGDEAGVELGDPATEEVGFVVRIETDEDQDIAIGGQRQDRGPEQRVEDALGVADIEPNGGLARFPGLRPPRDESQQTGDGDKQPGGRRHHLGRGPSHERRPRSIAFIRCLRADLGGPDRRRPARDRDLRHEPVSPAVDGLDKGRVSGVVVERLAQEADGLGQ